MSGRIFMTIYSTSAGGIQGYKKSITLSRVIKVA